MLQHLAMTFFRCVVVYIYRDMHKRRHYSRHPVGSAHCKQQWVTSETSWTN